MIRSTSRRHLLPASAVVLAASLAFTGCASGPSPGDAGPADESVWEELLEPRPEPLPGAVRVTVAEFLVVQATDWDLASTPVSPGLTLSELVAAGLLRRRDVSFVERRRFSEAAERARRGLPRPSGAPPVGRSPGAELILAGSWAPADSATGVLSLRLTEVETGNVIRSWRVETPPGADPTSLARATTGSLLEELGTMDRRPGWTDPLRSRNVVTAPARYRDTGIPVGAVVAFARGLAAEEAYDWEEARAAYQTASEAGGEAFFEPRVALARIARLRAGGTLGASD